MDMVKFRCLRPGHRVFQFQPKKISGKSFRAAQNKRYIHKDGYQDFKPDTFVKIALMLLLLTFLCFPSLFFNRGFQINQSIWKYTFI